MTEEQNKLAEEIERQLTPFFSRSPSNLPLPAPGVVSKSIELPVPEWHQIIAALREPATEAVLEESELRAIASRHARDAVAPLGSNVHPGDPVVMQEKLRAEEIIFYALKEAALKGKGASQGDMVMVPREPTQEMVTLMNYSGPRPPIREKDVRLIWETMLTAAGASKVKP